MSSNSDTFLSRGTSTNASAEGSERKRTYSLKRWSGFDAWQQHVRKSAASVGVAFAERNDRDLRRAIVTG
jgi:hypothetical protein